jgi:hypothetical protein
MSEETAPMADELGPVEIQTTQVDVLRGGVTEITAQHVNFRDGGVVQVQAESMDFAEGVIFLASAQQAEVKESSLGALFADSASLQDSSVNLVVARKVQGSPVRTAVLLAGRVDGPVETSLDTPRALLAGLAAGVGMGLVLMLNRLLFGRRR